MGFPTPVRWGGMEDFAGGSFVSGGGNLTGSDFDHSNLVFKTKKKNERIN